jgi:hypothetical protein
MLVAFVAVLLVFVARRAVGGSDEARPPAVTSQLSPLPRAVLSPASFIEPAESPRGDSEPTATAQFSESDVSLLDARRRYALGMIETGNDDREVGRAGEISRYQIMPSVWKHYSDSRNYQNPDVSIEVAQQHWSWLHNYFKTRANREPTDFDMYVLWNTRAGYYQSKGFNSAAIHPVIRDRAQRFVNLVERGSS